MDRNSASSLLRRLEHGHVAPKGEVAVDLERAAPQGAAAPEPVLLLTDKALYASGAKHWTRLPLDKVQSIAVTSDPSGMLTRYRVVDAAGEPWFDVALPMARSSFRARMEELQSRRDAAADPSAATRVPTALASLAALASARSMASAATLVSAASVAPVASRAARSSWPSVRVA